MVADTMKCKGWTVNHIDLGDISYISSSYFSRYIFTYIDVTAQVQVNAEDCQQAERKIGRQEGKLPREELQHRSPE